MRTFLALSLSWLIVLLSLFVTNASSGPCPNNICNAGEIMVQVPGQGNVPKYSFWMANDNKTVYSVMFQQIFEAVNGSKYGQSNIALPSQTWVWSEFVGGNGTGVQFNITAYNLTHGNTVLMGRLQFRNYIAFSNTSLNSSSLKFDVEVDDYSWASPNPNANLVLMYNFNTNGGNDTTVSNSSSNIVYNGNAFFSIEPTATTSSNNWVSSSPINVQLLNYASSGNGIWVSYGHFNGSMIHDPEMGFSSSSGNNPKSNRTRNIIIGVCVGVGAVLVVLIAIGAFVWWRKRRTYDSL
jgi:hypothetical protein